MYCVYLFLLLFFFKFVLRESASNIWCSKRRETNAVPKGEGVPGGWKTTWRIIACQKLATHKKKCDIRRYCARGRPGVFADNNNYNNNDIRYKTISFHTGVDIGGTTTFQRTCGEAVASVTKQERRS